MKAFILLTTLAVSTAPAAADAPVYELVWPVGNALFRWHDGGAELVLRTQAPIDAVCSAKGGIAFISGGFGYFVPTGSAVAQKLRGAARKGKFRKAMSCTLDGTQLKVDVATADFDSDAGVGDDTTLVLPLQKGVSVLSLVRPSLPESDAPAPGGKLAWRERSINNKYGEFSVLERVSSAGGGAVLLADTWKESESECSEEEGEPMCLCPYSIGRKGWLPGGAAWALVYGGDCGHGSSKCEVRVVPPDGSSVLSGDETWDEDSDLDGSPDARSWHFGHFLCGPKGDCIELPKEAARAVWSER